MSEHNAIGTRVRTRPVWATFLLLFLTAGVYRIYWSWRTNTDVGDFARVRAERGIGPDRAVRVNAAASATAVATLTLGATVLLFGLLASVGSIPEEAGVDPTTGELITTMLLGLVLVAPGVVATLRTMGRVRRARELAGLAPSTHWTGRAFAPLVLLELVGVPASMFAVQHALDDLWSRYPPLLDEDLHGELAPPRARPASLARRPALHHDRLVRIADELDRPWLVPWVTIAFGALCISVFAWQLSVHGPFPGRGDAERVGALRTGIDGTWWRFWTANVLHGSVEHLAGNMLSWGVVGTIVERVVGHARMVGLIVVGAAGCSAGALVAHPSVASLGASGVVFASFGLAAMVDPLARRSVGKLGWSLVALGVGLSTFTPGISSGGHVGGVLAGLGFGGLVALVWRIPRPRRTGADRAARLALRVAPVDRTAPLAPDRELSVAERLAHLAREAERGVLAPVEHERLRRALLHRG